MSVLADLIECVNFAAIKHRDQRRKDHSATPYINHPIGLLTTTTTTVHFNVRVMRSPPRLTRVSYSGVARILTAEAKVTDLHVLQAALLHDTGVTIISSHF